jgi:hypothetical protein
MNIINKTAFILFTIVSLNGFSQGWKGYEWDVFPVDRRWRQGGLTGSLGINYTLGYPGQQQKQTAQLGFFQGEFKSQMQLFDDANINKILILEK